MFVEATTLTKLDTFSKIAIAVLGGIWTLLTYVRGRTFRRRLEPKITGEVFEEGGARFLSIVASARNVGLSKAEVIEDGTWVRIFLLKKKNVKSFAVPAEVRLGTAPILLQHSWIEPGEEVHDVLIVQLPEKSAEDIGVRLDLRVKSQEWRWIPPADYSGGTQVTAEAGSDLVRNLIWNAAAIVPMSAAEKSSGDENPWFT